MPLIKAQIQQGSFANIWILISGIVYCQVYHRAIMKVTLYAGLKVMYIAIRT